MKKLLAMVLALVMTLSLAVSANAAFKDADKVSADYSEAVAVLNGMGVFKGYEDGSFQPQGNITRAEVAAIVYRVYTADVKDAKASMYATYNKFSDMAGAGWAQGYIGYCANAALVKGYPNGTFQPSGKVTGYEVLAMILRAIGYDQNNEFTGADWALHVAQTAQQAGVLKNVKGVDLNAPATRELVAELLFRAIADAPMVTYTAAFGYQTVSFNGKKDDNKTFSENDTLGFKSFKLKSDDKTADEFGRPTVTWTYDVGDKKTVVDVEPLATYTEAAKNCDIYADSGLKKDTKLDVYTNSKTSDGTYTVADNKDDSKQADQGRLTLVYDKRLVNIDTYLAKVDKFVAEKTDSKGHTTSAYVDIKTVYGFTGKFDSKFETDDEFKADDMVLVTIADKTIESVALAETKTAALTQVSGNVRNITDIQKVMGLDKADATVNCTATYAPATMTLGTTYNFYFDTYGNVIGADDLATNYVVLDKLYITSDKGDDSAHGTVYALNGDKTDVDFDKINGKDVDDKNFSDGTSSASNSDMYHKVYSYTVNKDGEYSLKSLTAADKFYTSDDAIYRDGSKYVMVFDENGTSSKLQLSKTSQILLQTKESPNGTFKPYTGYEGVPSFHSSNVYYKLDSLGYVSVLYALADEFTTRTVFIYDTTPVHSTYGDDYDVATMKVLELVDGKWENTTVDLILDDDNPAYIYDVDTIGLYELVEGEDNAWFAIEQYRAYNISEITTDGLRVYINGEQEDLDDAKIVKYTGSWTEGKYDTDWSAKEMLANGDAFGYVQYDEDDKVVAVYDVRIPVLVNDETSSSEFFARDFQTIKVDNLSDYDEVLAVMEYPAADGTVAQDKLIVTYYKDGEKVTMDSENGTKVDSAEISFNGKVKGDIVYTIVKQAAYEESTLKNGTVKFDVQTQYVVISDDSVKVEFNNGNVTVEQIKKALKSAKKFDGQTVEIYNTNADKASIVPESTTWTTGGIPYDTFARVYAADGVHYTDYTLSTNA